MGGQCIPIHWPPMAVYRGTGELVLPSNFYFFKKIYRALMQTGGIYSCAPPTPNFVIPSNFKPMAAYVASHSFKSNDTIHDFFLS